MHALPRSVLLTLVLLAGQLHAAEEITKLDPIVVEESRLKRDLFYCEVPGFEILSAFSAEKTKEIALALQRQRALLSLIIPPAMQAPAGVRHALILDEQEPPFYTERIEAIQNSGKLSARGQKAEAAEEMQKAHAIGTRNMVRGASYSAQREVLEQSLAAIRGQAGPFGGGPSPRPDALSTRSAHAASPDQTIFYVNIFGIDFSSPFTSVSGEVQKSLAALFPLSALYLGRTPRLPLWLERQIDDGANGSFLAVRRFTLNGVSVHSPNSFTPPSSKSPLTVEQLLTERPLAERGEAWREFARILVNWALMEDQPARAAAFWKFADLATREPVTTELFTRCFGEKAWKQLMATASGSRGVLDRLFRQPKEPPGEMPVVRAPTRAESVRIRSEYEWRVGQEFGDAVPFLDLQTRDQAGRRLRRAYADGERDPQFLAVLALYECDAGPPADARQRVEEAAATHVVRPWLYYQQARLRSIDQIAKLSGPGDKLTAEQTRRVLDPLGIARAQSPALSEVYHLLTETWARSAITPTRAEFTALAEGVRLFPRDPLLAYKIALLHARANLAEETARLAAQGLLFAAPGSELHTRLTALQVAAKK